MSAAEARPVNDHRLADEEVLDNEEMLTVVSESPVPSEIDKSERCLLRSAGQVCICDACEAARLRMLHRSGKKKRPAEPREVFAAAKIPKKEGEASATAAERGRALATQEKLDKMSAACRTILECIGEDPEREGLLKTPDRWARSLLFMCSGYEQTPADVTNGAVFSENHDEMVVVRNIDIHSLCEHHVVPFTGKVHVGYIPNGKILGLSKLARIAELYSRRLQVQERLTRQIADAVVDTVEPLGVAVVVECTHFCMVMRGVQKTGSVTTTSSVRGCFESNPKTRAEFFSIIHGAPGGKLC
jgi:GTP cyclohydrolase I